MKRPGQRLALSVNLIQCNEIKIAHIQEYDKTLNNLIKWVEGPRRGSQLQSEYDAQTEFAVYIPDNYFDDSVDMVEEFMEAASETEITAYYLANLEQLLLQRFGENGELNLVDDYLKRRGWREPALGKRYLTALRDSEMSVYEVIGCDRGKSVTVMDQINGGDSYVGYDRQFSNEAAIWDCVSMRILKWGGKHYLTDYRLDFDREIIDALFILLNALVKEFQLMVDTTRNQRPADVSDLSPSERRQLSRDARCDMAITQFWLAARVVDFHADRDDDFDIDSSFMCHEVRFPLKADWEVMMNALNGAPGLELADDREAWEVRGPEFREHFSEYEASLFNDVLDEDLSDDGLSLVYGMFHLEDDSLVLITRSGAAAERMSACSTVRLAGGRSLRVTCEKQSHRQ